MGMPFLEQDRSSKAKEIYAALIRDHPEMPSEMKARISERKSRKDPRSRKSPKDGGPKYKGPITHYRVGRGKDAVYVDKSENRVAMDKQAAMDTLLEQTVEEMDKEAIIGKMLRAIGIGAKATRPLGKGRLTSKYVPKTMGAVRGSGTTAAQDARVHAVAQAQAKILGTGPLSKMGMSADTVMKIIRGAVKKSDKGEQLGRIYVKAMRGATEGKSRTATEVAKNFIKAVS